MMWSWNLLRGDRLTKSFLRTMNAVKGRISELVRLADTRYGGPAP